MHSSVLILVLVALLSQLASCGKVAPSSRSKPFRELASSIERIPVPVQSLCSDLYGKANAVQNFNDSKEFSLSAEYPTNINLYYGAQRFVTKSEYYYPINLISTTYAYLGSGTVTVSDGYGSLAEKDEEVTVVLARGDFINTITVNYNTGSVGGTLGAVYGLTFYSYCNCSASVGFFDGSVNMTYSVSDTFALEYFAGATAADINNRAYISAIKFCMVQQTAPQCPTNPCSQFAASSDDTETSTYDIGRNNSTTTLTLPTPDALTTSSSPDDSVATEAVEP